MCNLSLHERIPEQLQQALLLKDGLTQFMWIINIKMPSAPGGLVWWVKHSGKDRYFIVRPYFSHYIFGCMDQWSHITTPVTNLRNKTLTREVTSFSSWHHSFIICQLWCTLLLAFSLRDLLAWPSVTIINNHQPNLWLKHTNIM